MRTPELIEQLTRDLEPVKPISSLVNVLLWILVSLISIFLILVAMPVRDFSDFASNSMTPIFLLWFLFNSVILARAANILGQPGRQHQRLILWSGLAIYFLSAGVLFALSLYLNSPLIWNGGSCILGVGLLSAVPTIVFFVLIKKMAPTAPRLMGLILGLSAGSVGAFGIGFSCENSDPLHVLFFHLLIPAVLISGLSVILAKKVFKW